MKYHLIHHGHAHTFDEYDRNDNDSDWITYVTSDGCRHGAPLLLLGESFTEACAKYAAHCIERVGANEKSLKQYAQNMATWSEQLLRFQQTLIPQ